MLGENHLPVGCESDGLLAHDALYPVKLRVTTPVEGLLLPCVREKFGMRWVNDTAASNALEAVWVNRFA